MKKLFAFLLVFCMVFSMLPAAAAAEAAEIASGTCGDDLTWVLDENYVLTISGTGSMYDFTGSDQPWEDYTQKITAVVIRDGVTSVGNYAFFHCYDIISVELPDSVRTIGTNAFFYCRELTSIALPAELTAIGDHAFGACYALAEANLPDKLVTIGKTAFSGSLLTSALIPDGVTSIGEGAFRGCPLTQVQIPASVTEIGYQVFQNCAPLTCIFVDPKNPAYCNDAQGAMYNKDCTTLIVVPGGFAGEFVIPETVTRVEASAFEYCGQLKAVQIPNTVTEIGANAFSRCEMLESVVLPDSVSEIKRYTFGWCDSLTNVTIPGSVTAIGQGAFCYCVSLEQIDLPDSLTTLGSSAFDDCTALKSIAIPEGITELAPSTFIDCEALEEVVLPDGLTQVGSWCFGNCISLTKITLPDTVQSIDYNAFSGCTALSEITIPASVEVIGNHCFSDAGLTAVTFRGDAPVFSNDKVFLNVTATAYYPADNETWTEDVMLDYGGTITWVSYANSLPCDDGYHVPGKDNMGNDSGFCEYCGIPCETTCTAIWALEEDGTLILYGTGENGAGEMKSYGWQDYADQIITLVVEDGITGEIVGFDMLENLTTAYLSKDITSIGSYAFQGCVSLKEVRLPATLSSNMGGRPFGGCTSLTGIWVDEANPYFANDEYGVLFNKDMTRLVEAPGALAGYYTIPETVTDIEWAAFDGCKQLIGVEIPDGVTWLQMNLFENCTALKSITIPASVDSMWINVFMGCTGLESVTFEGGAPDFMGDCFQGVTATAYYPAGNETWTEDVMQNYGGTITWVAYGAEEVYTTKWVAASPSLNGTIDLNVYATMSDNLVNNPDTFVRFTYAGNTVDVPMSEAKLYQVNGENRYRFTVKLFAKQMTEVVTSQVMVGDKAVGEPLDYSIETYCIKKINQNTDAKLVTLCKAVLNYGAAAQKMFTYKLDKLANASLSDADKVLADADASAYKHSVTGTGNGITAKRVTLVLESEIAIRVYFALDAGKSPEDFTFTIDGNQVTPVASGELYYIELKGIAAKDMDVMHKFSAGGVTVNYCALSYVNSKLSSTDENTLNMAKALFAYYSAAEAFLG